MGGVGVVYRIAGYIGGNTIWWIARKLQLADIIWRLRYDRHAVGAILVDLILAV